MVGGYWSMKERGMRLLLHGDGGLESIAGWAVHDDFIICGLRPAHSFARASLR
jgi:hypothetical protein